MEACRLQLLGLVVSLLAEELGLRGVTKGDAPQTTKLTISFFLVFFSELLTVSNDVQI